VKSWHPEAETPGLPDAVRGSKPPSKVIARELAAKAVARYAEAIRLKPAWR